MSFNEPSFLFLFLPALLLLYYAIPRGLSGARNALLLLASVIFYMWGGKEFVFVLAGAVVVNYGLALAIERARGSGRAKPLLILAVTANLAVLVIFKYMPFLAGNLNDLLGVLKIGAVPVPKLLFPLGISYFVFHAISYVVDIYRGEAKADRSLPRTALYLMFFPKMIAGPITRYRDLAGQLGPREESAACFAAGVKRFTLGMAKKVIIASAVAGPADKIFAIPTAELTPSLAWLGLLCYTVQIYFDFSGYSDMAIGLGEMFGLMLPENFDYPYIADSIRDFWRRWHISLSSWLRDYLFIPLGGSRVSTLRVYFNLVIVFVICGFWHGASWSFIAWGLYYGLFLVLERLGLGKLLEASWRPIRHVYALAVILGGWVFFRASTLHDALGFLGALVGVSGGAGVQDGVQVYLNPMLILALIVGAIGSIPVLPWLKALRLRQVNTSADGSGSALELAWTTLAVLWIGALMLASGALIAAKTYSPFIYRQF